MAIGFVTGVAVYALVGPGAVRVPEAVQVVLITVIAGAVGVSGVVVAAAITADAAREATKLASADRRRDLKFQREIRSQDRADNREARLHDRKVALLAEVLQGAHQHANQVRQQVARRQEVANSGADPASIPSLDPTDRIGEAAGALYAFADRATADAAWGLYNLLLSLDRFAYVADRHRIGNTVARLEPEELLAHDELQQQFLQQRTALFQRIRVELGLPPLVPSSASASDISGSAATTR